MSLKRSSSSRTSSFGGGGDPGAKVDRQELFDELKKQSAANVAFTPVDISLAIGAGEPQVSKALLGLAAEGYLEKVEVGRYKSTPMGDMTQAEFIKAYARASKVDSTRQRDLSEIARLKQNNDTMRHRLLSAIAERDHYLAALKKHAIDPGPVPLIPPPASMTVAAPVVPVVAAPAPADPAAPAPAETAAPEPAPSIATVPVPPPAPTSPALPVPAAPGSAVPETAAPGPDALSAPSPASESAPSGPGDVGRPG